MMQEAVPKIEGHATFYAHLKAGKVEKAQIIGLENDRFVEKILVGRKYYEAPIITSRICGICPTIHNVTSTKAIEEACGIATTKQTNLLRELMLSGQMIQSHALHLYLLVLPDFVGVSSSFELQQHHPELFQNAIALKRFADAILNTVGGRAVHPIASVPGGFKSYPSKKELKELLTNCESIEQIAKKTISLFNSFHFPEIKQNLTYNSLYLNQKEYAFYDGDIKNSSGLLFKAKNYKSYIYEELKPYTRAKFGTLKGREIMVGAIARYNNMNSIRTELKETIELNNIEEKFDNPFDNILAQAIELLYFVKLANKLLTYFAKEGIIKEKLIEPTHYDEGVGSCEAPRGTLFHYYKLNKDGFITECDIITPTVQNLPALESDMKTLLDTIKDKDIEERNHIIEMLIRAYDPCITCATH